MEEARALLDSAERGKRQTESELTEARMAVNEMNNVNSRAAADKRRQTVRQCIYNVIFLRYPHFNSMRDGRLLQLFLLETPP